jgi:hypothetical protein
VYGQYYGPNYWLMPPFAPFNGAVFARQATANPLAGRCAGAAQGAPGAAGFPGFPTHPFARSPRDFFMME